MKRARAREAGRERGDACVEGRKRQDRSRRPGPGRETYGAEKNESPLEAGSETSVLMCWLSVYWSRAEHHARSTDLHTYPKRDEPAGFSETRRYHTCIQRRGLAWDMPASRELLLSHSRNDNLQPR